MVEVIGLIVCILGVQLLTMKSLFTFSSFMLAALGQFTVAPGASGLAGVGDWTLGVYNGYTSSGGATSDFEITLSVPCDLQCSDSDACNSVPESLQVNPSLGACLYPKDLFVVVHDCDRVCFNDADGICDELY